MHELCLVYDAEHQFLEGQEEMAQEATDGDLESAKALGDALAFLSVGLLALVVALVTGHSSVSLVDWPLGASLSDVRLLGLVPLEMALAELLEERRARGKKRLA